MARLIELILLTFIAWVVWRQVIREWRGSHDARRQPPPVARPSGAGAAGPAPAAAPGSTLVLVRCAACGVHVPSDRLLTGSNGRVFCSPACRAREGA